MTQHLEPCPMCGKAVAWATALDPSEDVRWAEWACPCGLTYHAESRVVDGGGNHDEETELAELIGAWNARAVRTCRMGRAEHQQGPGARLAVQRVRAAHRHALPSAGVLRMVRREGGGRMSCDYVCPWCGCGIGDPDYWEYQPEEDYEVECDCGHILTVSFYLDPVFTVAMPKEMGVCEECAHWNPDGHCGYLKPDRFHRDWLIVHEGYPPYPPEECPQGHGQEDDE